VRRALVALFAISCGYAATDLEETTTGGSPVALECLYDGDCGEDGRCQAGACVMQCEGEDCCMIVGECDPPPPCGDASDCPRGFVCDAGTCELPLGRCAEPPEPISGLVHG
jgi:hypothetical protein